MKPNALRALLLPAALVLVLVPAGSMARPGPFPQSVEPEASPAPARPPASVSDIIARAERWTVAIEVERDEEPARGRVGGRRLSAEARTYYRRPDGPVSGVLTATPGEVVTSLYNVMGNVKSLRVTFPDGTTRAAKVVARSEHDDLALIRASSDGGPPPAPDPPLEWAGRESIRAGQIVFAAGRSPDPRTVTITHGIISATSRNGGRVIQTDAELNYGNAGGPILDLEGRIVAVASLVGHTQPQWGFNSGVGFGVSSSTVLELIPKLATGKDVPAPRPPFLGVQKDPRAPDIEGARVSEILPGTAADLAGIRVGDVILELDGTPIHSFDHLRRLVYGRKGGEVVKLKVRRGTEVIVLEPRLQARGMP